MLCNSNMFPIIYATYYSPTKYTGEKKRCSKRLTSLEINPILRDISREKYK